MKRTATVFLFFLATFQIAPSFAQATGSGTTAAAAASNAASGDSAIPKPPESYHFINSSGDFSGVRLSYPVRVKAALADDKSKFVCIPANFPLRGLGLITSSGVPVKLRPDFADDPIFEKFTECDEKPGEVVEMAKLKAVVGRALVIEEETTKMFTPRSNGLTYGILIVPFKYYVNGSRDFKGAGTVGPYAGWKIQSSRLAAGLEIAAFAGLSAVTSEKITDGKATSETLAAFGYGLAAIGRIQNNFQVGIVAGQDRVGKSSQYKDNGKWWIALSIGFPFSN